MGTVLGVRDAVRKSFSHGKYRKKHTLSAKRNTEKGYVTKTKSYQESRELWAKF